jgi:hypothetical protein
MGQLPIVLGATGAGAVVLCSVLGEGTGVRSDEAESKICDVREFGNARFQLIR